MSDSIKKILSVQHYPHFGGPHNEIVTQERYFRSRDYETVVAITDEAGNAATRLSEVVDVHAIPLHRLRRPSDVRHHLQLAMNIRKDVTRLADVARSTGAAIVRVHGAHNPQGAFAARKADLPVVWVLSSDIGPLIARRLGMHLVSRFADAVLVNGGGLIGAYPGLEAMGEKVFVYRSPVAIERFLPVTTARRESARQKLGLPVGATVIGTLANITPQKDIELFVETCGELSRSVPEARFVVLGGPSEQHGAYMQAVEAAAESAGLLPDRLLFAGKRDDVADVLPALDVKVITSRFEGTTTTAGEALASEVPVVSVDVGSVSDIVVDGKTGILVKDRTARSLTEGVLTLIAQPEVARRMASAGRARVMELSDASVCADQQMAAYEFALRSRTS